MVVSKEYLPQIKPGSNNQLRNYIDAIRNNNVQVLSASEVLRKEVIIRLKNAIRKLYREDKILLSHKMNEVTVCGRLAIYLQNQFKDFNGYYIDVEYYMLSVPPDEYQGGNKGRIRCDILFHSRGYYGCRADILMALEAKYTPEGIRGRADRKRLEKLTALYNPNIPSNAVHSTLVGVFLRFNEHGGNMSFYSSGVEKEIIEFKAKKRCVYEKDKGNHFDNIKLTFRKRSILSRH